MATAKAKTAAPVAPAPRATKTKLAVVKPVLVGSAIDALWELKQKKAEAEKAVKAIEEQIAAQEEVVFSAMDEQQLDAAKGSKSSASISKSTSFNIADFDAFTKFVKKNNFFHLFQRRLSEAAVREIFEVKGKVDGLEPFTKRRLNTRTLG